DGSSDQSSASGGAKATGQEATGMIKVLINECKQEVSTFNPLPSGLNDFSLHEGQDFLAMHRGANREVGGALEVLEAEPGIQVIGGFSAQAITSGGVLAAGEFAQIAERFLAAVEANRDVGAVYFSLHGAMSVEGEGDPEGYLLHRTRANRKSTRLNSSHVKISYAVFCLKKKKKKNTQLSEY